MNDIVQGDVGVVIDIRVHDDISDATLIQFIIDDRSGTVKTLNAGLRPGDTEVVEYVTTGTDFDTAGRWFGQVRIVQPTKIRRSPMFVIDVRDAL